MLEEYNKSTPKQLKAFEWHVPFGDSINQDRVFELADKVYPDSSSSLSASCGFKLLNLISEYDCEAWDEVNQLKRKISIARCARISYLNFEGKDDYEADVKLCEKLFQGTPKHLSPCEHVAQATDNSDFIGNFRGFKQFRYTFSDQNLTDPRVIKK